MISGASPRNRTSGASRPAAASRGAGRPGSQESAARRFRRAVFGRQPIGMIFGAPYALFIAALFAYPLGLAV